MRLLADWTIQHGTAERKIELLHGDLTHLPPEHAVDVLVVSAFPNDYVATQGSLIGALDRAGLSIVSLSEDKQADLRQQYSCWLSKPIKSNFNFRYILCIESGWRGTPPEITDDLFRALAPYLLTDFANGSAAMSLIGAGDQGWPPKQMLQAILLAAVNWIERGLPLKLLKIVIYSENIAHDIFETFISSKQRHSAAIEQPPPVSAVAGDSQYDVFLSYAHEEMDIANYVVDNLRKHSHQAKIFHDKVSLREGSTWLMQIANALDSSRRVVALYSPSYWTSKNCQMEFLASFTRQNDTGNNIIFPIYLSEAKIPYMFRSLQYSDCRVNDRIKLAIACSRLATESQPAPQRS
jgi:hypothetical protein